MKYRVFPRELMAGSTPSCRDGRCDVSGEFTAAVFQVLLYIPSDLCCQYYVSVQVDSSSRHARAGVTASTEDKQVQKVLWTRKVVCATVVTAGHCMYAELPLLLQLLHALPRSMPIN